MFRPGVGWRPSAAGEDSIAGGGPTIHSLLTQIAGDTVLREATEDDHSSLLALEGTAPNAGASLIQARANFFARTDAYSVSQVLAAEREGAYAGSWTGISRRGTAWLSLWDDRAARGLDPFAFRAVKAFDLMLEGPEALGAFASLVGVLRARGVRQLLVPLPAESTACAMLRPFAADLVDFNFVVKRPGGSPPVPPGPLYFDIRAGVSTRGGSGRLRARHEDRDPS